jgi:hypothetical protein
MNSFRVLADGGGQPPPRPECRHELSGGVGPLDRSRASVAFGKEAEDAPASADTISRGGGRWTRCWSESQGWTRMTHNGRPELERGAWTNTGSRVITRRSSCKNGVAGRVGEEEVSAPVAALSATLESSTSGGERAEVSIVRDGDQHVCIFGVVLVSGQRTDQRDSSDAWIRASPLDEPQRAEKTELTGRRFLSAPLGHLLVSLTLQLRWKAPPAVGSASLPAHASARNAASS